MNHNPESAVQVQRALEQAQSLLTERRYAEAQTEFEQLITRYARQRSANIAPAYIGLADCCLALGSTEQATSVLRRAARRYPRDAEILSHLARAYAEQGEVRAALNHARRALKEDPHCANALKVMAKVHLRQGKLKEAIIECLEALRINRQWDAMHDILVGALEKGNHLEEAVVFLQAGLDFDPSHQTRWFKLADLYCRLNRWMEAEKTLRDALNAPGDPARVHHMLAELYYTLRDYERAIEEGCNNLRLNPRNLSMLDLLASAYLQQGDMLSAIDMTTRAVRMMPLDPVSRFKLAALCHQKGDIARAAQEYQRLITLHPNNVWARDAQDALHALDRYQLHQIFALAADSFVFRVKLKREMAATLEEYGFYLTEHAMGMLENMDFDDMLDYDAFSNAQSH
jgi:tetratricopeptide (TPR) repeat protein